MKYDRTTSDVKIMKNVPCHNNDEWTSTKKTALINWAELLHAAGVDANIRSNVLQNMQRRGVEHITIRDQYVDLEVGGRSVWITFREIPRVRMLYPRMHGVLDFFAIDPRAWEPSRPVQPTQGETTYTKTWPSKKDAYIRWPNPDLPAV